MVCWLLLLQWIGPIRLWALQSTCLLSSCKTRWPSKGVRACVCMHECVCGWMCVLVSECEITIWLSHQLRSVGSGMHCVPVAGWKTTIPCTVRVPCFSRTLPLSLSRLSLQTSPLPCSNEYLCFQRVMKAEYVVPDGFPDQATDLVKSLLVRLQHRIRNCVSVLLYCVSLCMWAGVGANKEKWVWGNGRVRCTERTRFLCRYRNQHSVMLWI